MTNNETLADIVREMREGVVVGDTEYVREPHLIALADRIEAAVEREREAARCCDDDETDDDETIDIDGIVSDPDYLPGDVAIALGL